MPFREEDADIVGNVLQAASGLAHILGRGVPVRSGHNNLCVPLVPESVGELVDAFPIELAIAFEGAGNVPTLTADIFDQLFGSLPTVELHKNHPTFGQQWA